jgi:hypothetical protein
MIPIDFFNFLTEWVQENNYAYGFKDRADFWSHSTGEFGQSVFPQYGMDVANVVEVSSSAHDPFHLSLDAGLNGTLQEKLMGMAGYKNGKSFAV